MTTKESAKPRNTRTLSATTAGALLMIVPFASFLSYNEHSMLHAESLLCIAVLGGTGAAGAGVAARLGGIPLALMFAALTTFYVDIQFDFQQLDFRFRHFFLGFAALAWLMRDAIATVLVAVLATILISDTTLAALRQGKVSEPSAHRPEYPGDRPPPLLHVLFDEQVGLEAFPVDLPGWESTRTRLETKLVESGFRVFSRAFSRYEQTKKSIASIVNFRDQTLDGDYADDRPGHLARNEYFERLGQLGYTIDVQQTQHIDYCGDGQWPVRNCRQRSAAGLSLLERSNAPAPCRTALLLSMYTNQSRSIRALRRRAPKAFEWGAICGTRHAVPSWVWTAKLVGTPLSGLDALTDLTTDIRSFEPSVAHFAHIMLPHHPHLLGSNCELLPPDQWGHPTDLSAGAGDRTRAKAYDHYRLQVDCVEVQIDALLAALATSGAPLGEAVVIFQGDHGSRLGARSPRAFAPAELSARDFADAYATLFAVKAPQFPAGVDTTLIAIDRILQRVVTKSPSEPTSAGSDRTVHVPRSKGPDEPFDLPSDFLRSATTHGS